MVVSVLVMLVVLSGNMARAELCTDDAVPGATLLLPYFEVDISDGNGDGDADGGGVNTIFTVHNASSNPTVAHVTFWTDWAFPVFDFDIFLTGYDTVEVDIFQVLAIGDLPVTADLGNDPSDTISPNGGNPDWDGAFASCNSVLPYSIPTMHPALLYQFQNSHSGYPPPYLSGNCAGEALNGSSECFEGCPPGTIARGYVTVDVVKGCVLKYPSEQGYFGDGGTGIATNDNILWGNFVFLDGTGTTAGGSLVAIEADDSFHTSSTATEYTFYGRYTHSAGGTDNREPMGTTWTARFGDSGSTNSSLVVWRDPTSSEVSGSGWTCGLSSAGAGPDWAPLGQTEVVCIDEATNVAETLCEGSECFPLATQRVAIGTGGMTPSFPSGWCHLNLNVDDTFTDDVDFPPPSGTLAQSYVYSLFSTAAQAAAATPGTMLASACEDNDLVFWPSAEPVFLNGFETGNLIGWSSTRP
jgi:hypothetical protein